MVRRFTDVLRSSAFRWIVLVSIAAALAAAGVQVSVLDPGGLPAPAPVCIVVTCAAASLLGLRMVWLCVGELAGTPLPKMRGRWLAAALLRQLGLVAAFVAALVVLAAVFGALVERLVLPWAGVGAAAAAVAVFAQAEAALAAPVALVVFFSRPVGYGGGRLPEALVAGRPLMAPLLAASLGAFAVSHVLTALVGLVTIPGLPVFLSAALSAVIGALWMAAAVSIALCWKTGRAEGLRRLAGVAARRWRRLRDAAAACFVSFVLAFGLFGSVSPAEAAELQAGTVLQGSGQALAPGGGSSAFRGDAGGDEGPAGGGDEAAGLEAQDPIDYYGEDELPGEPVAIDGDATVFKTSDRHYTSVVGGRDLAYVDASGEVKPIDNTLVEDGGSYCNESNSFTARLPRDMADGRGIVLKTGLHTIEMLPLDGDFSRSAAEGNAIRYTEVQDGIDYQYTLVGSLVKEDIVLNREVEARAFRTKLKLSAGLAVSMEEGVAVVRDAEGAEVASIGAPSMEDAAGVPCDEVDLSLGEQDGCPTLEVSVNWDWVRAPERAYPVRIDPTVDVASSMMRVTCVEQSWPDVSVGENGYAYAGYDDGIASGTGSFNYGQGHGICRVYASIGDNFNYIMSEARINSASFSLYQYTTLSGGGTKLGLYRVTSPWGVDGLTWNGQTGLEHELVQYQQTLPWAGYISWDIRETVNNWVQGITPQHGFCVKAENERWMQCEVFMNRFQANPPKLEVNWEIPDPVGDDYPLSKTTVKLRPAVEKSVEGLQAVDGVSADGMATPRSTVAWELTPRGDKGVSYASRSYKYPDSSAWEGAYPRATKYRDKLSNWQSLLFTKLAKDTIYRVRAVPALNGQTGAEARSEPFLVYKAKVTDTLPYIAKHYKVPLGTLAADNRVQDSLSIKGNTLFVRNPKTAEAYAPKDLSIDQKKRIDSALMGRGKHCEYGFEPINLNTGNYALEATDASIPEVEGDFALTRTYNSKAADQVGPFGCGWSFAWEGSLSFLDADTIAYRAGDGKVLYFDKASGGTYACPLDASLTIVSEKVKKGGKQLTRWRLKHRGGGSELFNEWGLLVSKTSQLGLTTKVERDDDLMLKAVVSPTGLRYGISCDGEGRVKRVSLPGGASLAYSYDEAGNLVSFTDANGGVVRYQYGTGHLMTAWTDPDGNRVVRNKYDAQGRVTSQEDAEGNTSRLSYASGATTATDAAGNATVYRVDSRMRTKRIDYPDGTSALRKYDAANNLVSDEDGKYAYDAAGNLLSSTSPDGVVTSYEYDSSNRLVAQVNPDGERVTYAYNGKGDLVSKRSSSGESWKFAYDSSHRLTRAVDADGVSVAYSYKGPWVASMTDALGNKTTYAYDAMGRRVSETGPTGATRRTAYDRAGNVTGETDGAGGRVSYTLTKAGRIKAVVDARGFRTTVGYDKRGNVTSAKDASGAVERFSYDAVGNRVSHTDASGAVERFSYDPRGRLASEEGADGAVKGYAHDKRGNVTSVTQADGSVYSYSYDRTYGNPVKAADPLGNASALEYDAAGRLTAAADPLGNRSSWSYAAGGRLVSATDAAGAVTTYAYTAAGRLASVDESGRTWSIGYDAAGRPIALTDPEGGQWGLERDAAGNLVGEADPLGNVVRHAYDGAGRETSRTDAEGGTVQMERDAAGNVVARIDERGAKTSYSYDSRGQLIAVTDPLGNASSLERDAAGNVTAQVDARGFRTAFRYDAAGRLVERIDPLGNSTAYAYDSRGNLVSVTDPAGNVEERSYDAAGNLASVTDAAGLRTEIERDAAGNVVATRDGAGRERRFSHDAAGRVTASVDPLGRVSGTEYDAWGDVVRETAPNGGVTAYERDGLGNVAAVTDALGGTTSFSRDAAGNLVKQVDANGGATAFQRDGAGRVVGMLDAAGGFWSYAYDAAGNVVVEVDGDGNRTSREYDAAGNLTSETDGLGHVTRYAYDEAGNLATALSPEGVLTSFAYDANGRLASRRDGAGGVVSQAYDALGNVASTTDALGSTTSYSHDALGRVTSWTDAQGGVTEYAYDLAGNLESIVGPQGARYSFSHDAAGRMTAAETPLGRSVAIEYDASDNVAGVGDNLGMSRSFSYDLLGRMTSAADASGGSRAWGYDALGNVTSFADEAGAVSEYAYDGLSRLVSATDASGGRSRYSYDARGDLVKAETPAGRSFEFFYDAAGNLTSRVDAQGNERTWEYDADGRVVATADASGRRESYAYDGADRVVSALLSAATGDGEGPAVGGARSWEYDAAGNVTSAADARGNAASFGYDALGRLASATDAAGSETRYAYDAAGNLVSATDARGNSTSYSHDAEGNLTGVTSPSGMAEALSRDAAGRVTSYANGAGEAVEYSYDAEGRLAGKSYPGRDGEGVSYAYDARGMVKSRSDWTGESAREYDALGRIASETDGAGNRLAYSYDADGNLAEVEYPDGSRASYEHDASGFLVGVSAGASCWRIGNDAEGRAVSVERPDGSTTSWERDGLGRVSAVRNLDAAGAAVAVYEYERDADGRISREESDVDGIGAAVREFSYDACGRLAACVIREDAGESVEEYGYDGAGNRTLATRSGARGSSRVEYEYDQDNRLVRAVSGAGVTDYGYDAAGNLVSKTGPGGEWEFSYGAEGRLRAVSEGGSVVMAAAYDGDGNRVWQAERYYATCESPASPGWEEGTEGEGGAPDAGAPPSEGGSTQAGASSREDGAPRNGGSPREGASPTSSASLKAGGGLFVAYAAVQGAVAALGLANPAASASLAQTLAATWFRAKGPLFALERGAVLTAEGGELAPTAAGALAMAAEEPLPADEEGSREMAERALEKAWHEGAPAGSWVEARSSGTAYVNTTLTGVAQPMAESGGLAGDAEHLYAFSEADGADDAPAVPSAEAPVVQAPDPAAGAAAAVPQASAAAALRQAAAGPIPGGDVPLMADPASGAAGLPAPASLGANAGSLSAVRLASSSGAAGVSYGWDGRGSATLRLDPAGSLSSALSFGPTGAVDSGAVGELSLLGWDGEDVLPAAGLVFLRARWMLAAEGVFASADLFLGAAGVPGTLNRYAFGLGDPVNRFDPSGRSSLFGRIMNAMGNGVGAFVSKVGRVTSAALSAMRAARAAGGTEWVVTLAGRTAAAIAARYCGSASYMGKTAPKPGGISYEQSALHQWLSAIGYGLTSHEAAFSLGKIASSMAKMLDAREMAKVIGERLGRAGVVISMIDANGYVSEYYYSHPELEPNRRENNASSEFTIHFAINLVGVLPPIEEGVEYLIYDYDLGDGRVMADVVHDFRWEYLGGKYGW